MCIIIAKDKKINKTPDTDTLRTCFNNNPDGAGICYTNHNKQVIIEKGFMNFKALNKRLKTLYRQYNNFKDKALLLHFRIGTSGHNDSGNTHPFPITYDYNLMRQTRLVTNLAFMHNGILSSYNPATGHNVSDTMIFNKKVLYSLFNINKHFLDFNTSIDLLEDTIGTSKLAFLDSNDNLTLIGDFITDNGLEYSNTTFRTSYSYSYSYGYSYNYDKNGTTTEPVSVPDMDSCDICGQLAEATELEFTRIWHDKGDFICQSCYDYYKEVYNL